MRSAFIAELLELVRSDRDIWLVTGDLGYNVLEPFAEAFPSRFLNAGVAEQTMLGLAAGVASCGPTVIVYSIGNFPTFRALEQLRNDIAYPRLPVITVAVGSGFSYGAHGSTHHAVEDLGAMRSLPGLTIVSPGDPIEAAAALAALVDRGGPAYLRLGKAGERVVDPGSTVPYRLGRVRWLRPRRAVSIMATGSILASAADAAQLLSERGVEVGLASAHTLHPFDSAAVLEAISEGGGLVTVEEHREHGGLRSVVAETLLAAGAATNRVRSVAVPADLRLGTGSQDHLRQAAGLSVDHIVAAVLTLIA